MTIDRSCPASWPVVMTLAEVADVARLAPRTVQGKAIAGEFQPAPLPGKPLRWRRCDVARVFEPSIVRGAK